MADRLQGTLEAISLVSQTAVLSAFINDVSAEMVYAQQVYGYIREGDVLICISTSGNSPNIVQATKLALAFGGQVIALSGESGEELSRFSSVLINVPGAKTFKIQEYHLPVFDAGT